MSMPIESRVDFFDNFHTAYYQTNTPAFPEPIGNNSNFNLHPNFRVKVKFSAPSIICNKFRLHNRNQLTTRMIIPVTIAHHNSTEIFGQTFDQLRFPGKKKRPPNF